MLPLPAAQAVAEADPCPGAQTTIDLDACAGRQRDAAERALHDGLRQFPVPAVLLTAWRAMRASTCDDLVGILLEGGSLRSLEETSCEARLTREFARTLGEPRNAPAHSSLYRVTRDADAFAARYRQQLASDRERAIFDRAQHDWLRFESQAATALGRSATMRLANERIADLQSTWIGERFW